MPSRDEFEGWAAVVSVVSLDDELLLDSVLPAGREAPRRRRSEPPAEPVSAVCAVLAVAADLAAAVVLAGAEDLGELARWCVSMAATRSPLRIPDAPAMPN